LSVADAEHDTDKQIAAGAQTLDSVLQPLPAEGAQLRHQMEKAAQQSVHARVMTR